MQEKLKQKFLNLPGFDLMTCDSYFTILVEVFSNHTRKYIFHEPYRVKRKQDSHRRFPPSSISFSSKSFVNIISQGAEITNYKDKTINCLNIYFLIDLFWRENHFVKLCNARKFDLSCSIERIISGNYHNVQNKVNKLQNFAKYLA